MANGDQGNRKSTSFTVSINLSKRLSFLRNFPAKIPDFNEKAEETLLLFCQEMEKKAGISAESWKLSRQCPSCGTGVLFPRKRSGEHAPSFMGCSKFPQCRHTESIVNTNTSATKKKE